MTTVQSMAPSTAARASALEDLSPKNVCAACAPRRDQPKFHYPVHTYVNESPRPVVPGHHLLCPMTHLPGSVVRRQAVVPAPLDGVDGELEQRRQVGEDGRVVGVHGQGRREDGPAENARRIVPREQPRHVRARGAQLDVVVVNRDVPVRYVAERVLNHLLPLQDLFPGTVRLFGTVRLAF